MPSLHLVPYGPPSAIALRDVLIAAKGDDALAAVTVAVPSNYVGLSLRQRLGSGELRLANSSGQSRSGLVNVRFVVMARIAELLGAPLLAGRGLRPLTSAVRGEAIRAVLAADPGVFGEVAGQAATERSLETSFRDLQQSTPAALDALTRQSARASHVVRLYRAFRERTVDYYDEDDLALAAAEAVRGGTPALRDVGHVALYLPRRFSPAERALVEALAAADGLSAIIGLTGETDTDAPARRLASQLEEALGAPEETPPQAPPVGGRIVAVPDAEEEVRATLRLVMERLASGTALHRMAVLYPVSQPYATLAHEQFAAAQVPHNSAAVRSLAQTLSGRTLLGLLSLRESDYRRDAMMDWLSAAPVLEARAGNPAPAHRWDALSRSAGVVAGAEQWDERLARFRYSLEARRDGEDDDSRLRRLDSDIKDTERLSRFVDELTRLVSPGDRSTWPEMARWARELLERYLGGEGHRRDWPDEEIEAHRAVEEALEALSNLVDVRPEVDEATFRRALERELEAPAGRIGRFGDGVFIGRVRDALGGDFDVVFLLGMSEGIIPSRGREDPLLPDEERSLAGEDVPLRSRRLVEERRDYLAALAAAKERVLLFPRADLRGQRGRLPSRWLLETASALEGGTLFSSDLEQLRRPWYTIVPSFEGALAGAEYPGSAQEYVLRSLLQWRGVGGDVTSHYFAAEVPVFEAGLRADLSRQGNRLTEWDGHVEGEATLRPSAEHPVSPTALQNWAACPFRYFLGRVLRVAETAQPEDAIYISPMERGNLIHNALEEFIREAPPRTSPGQPWSVDERSRLAAIGERLCGEFEAAGLTGRRLLWRLEREQILRDLERFLDEDQQMREEWGVVPAEVELSFGDDAGSAVTVSLEDGRSVAFRGRIDRVDQAPDGSRLLVMDYKTGSTGPYKKLKIDPMSRGKLLQLPIYALAAQRRFGERPTAAYYWFVREQQGYELLGYDVTSDKLEAFRNTLGVIVDGIEGGFFPARPGESTNTGYENCGFCPFDQVCPTDRARAWRRKRGAPELRAYVQLAEPDD